MPPQRTYYDISHPNESLLWFELSWCVAVVFVTFTISSEVQLFFLTQMDTIDDSKILCALGLGMGIVGRKSDSGLQFTEKSK